MTRVSPRSYRSTSKRASAAPDRTYRPATSLRPCAPVCQIVRFQLRHRSVRRAQFEISLCINDDAIRTFKGNPDLGRISAGAQDEVVLEMPSISMEHGIDAGVHGRIPYARVIRNATDPIGFISDEVTGGADQLLLTGRCTGPGAADETHGDGLASVHVQRKTSGTQKHDAAPGCATGS